MGRQDSKPTLKRHGILVAILICIASRTTDTKLEVGGFS